MKFALRSTIWFARSFSRCGPLSLARGVGSAFRSFASGGCDDNEIRILQDKRLMLEKLKKKRETLLLNGTLSTPSFDAAIVDLRNEVRSEEVPGISILLWLSDSGPAERYPIKSQRQLEKLLRYAVALKPLQGGDLITALSDLEDGGEYQLCHDNSSQIERTARAVRKIEGYRKNTEKSRCAEAALALSKDRILGKSEYGIKIRKSAQEIYLDVDGLVETKTSNAGKVLMIVEWQHVASKEHLRDHRARVGLFKSLLFEKNKAVAKYSKYGPDEIEGVFGADYFPDGLLEMAKEDFVVVRPSGNVLVVERREK